MDEADDEHKTTITSGSQRAGKGVSDVTGWLSPCTCTCACTSPGIGGGGLPSFLPSVQFCLPGLATDIRTPYMCLTLAEYGALVNWVLSPVPTSQEWRAFGLWPLPHGVLQMVSAGRAASPSVLKVLFPLHITLPLPKLPNVCPLVSAWRHSDNVTDEE